MRSTYLFTSESVSEGHPDKVSDQISDAIVDLLLSKDPEARVACETLTTTQRVVLAGELRCKGVYENGAWVDGALEEIEQTVRRTVREIGYEQDGFHWETLTFENHLHGQRAGGGCDRWLKSDRGADAWPQAPRGGAGGSSARRASRRAAPTTARRRR